MSFQKIDYKIHAREKNIHSEDHEIARQLWEYYGKEEKFGLFLGLLKRHGKAWGYQMLSGMQDYLRQKGQKFPIQILMTIK